MNGEAREGFPVLSQKGAYLAAMEERELNNRLRFYERTRDELAASARSTAESYDKALLTLSSAFLGGSLAFIQEIVPLDGASNKVLLYFAWAGFALTIVFTVWSFVYGSLQYERLRLAAERYYMKGEEAARKVSEDVTKEVLRFTVVCGALFVLGVVLLVAFVLVNLLKG